MTGNQIPLKQREMKSIMGGKSTVHNCNCNLYDSMQVSIIYTDDDGQTSAAMSPASCDAACSSLCDQHSCTDYNVFFHYEESDSF